jgi:hypothetical protein
LHDHGDNSWIDHILSHTQNACIIRMKDGLLSSHPPSAAGVAGQFGEKRRQNSASAKTSPGFYD